MSFTHALKRNMYVAYHYGLRRQKTPLLASFKLTYRCNLRCHQCPFYTMTGAPLKYTMACDMLDQLYQRGNRLVIFEGGEPMLWRDDAHTLHDLVAYAQRSFYCVGMTSNGTLPLDVMTDVLWVSVDGFAETHNALRGANIFDCVMENIRASRHPKLFAHITVNAKNYTEMPELIRYLSGVVKGITLQFYYPYSAEDALYLDVKRRSGVIDAVIALKKEGYPVLNSVPALRSLHKNAWRCADWLFDCANPDGIIRQGCYLNGRSQIDCTKCGFTPYTEASLAYSGRIGAIKAGLAIFFKGVWD